MAGERTTRDPWTQTASSLEGELATPLARAAGLLAALADPDVLRAISWMLDRTPQERAAGKPELLVKLPDGSAVLPAFELAGARHSLAASPAPSLS